MPYTQDEIKTIALKELGRSDEPDFLDSDDNDVRNINLQYENILADCLCRYNWSFAGEYAKLDTPTASTGKFLFAHSLPDDLLMVRAVYEDDRYSFKSYDYEIIKGVLYTNKETIYINYTTRLAEENMPAAFVEWLKFRLALEMATNTTGDFELMQYLVNKEAQCYQNAVNQDTRQKGVKVLDTGVFVDVR